MSQTGLMNLGLLLFFILLIYFMMIRPQRKRDKEVNEMRSGLTKGDEIVTIGGILGKIVQIKEDTVVINVGRGGTNIEILKTAVGSVSKPNTAARKANEEKAEQEKEKEHEAEVKTSSTKKVTPKKLTPKKEHEDSEEGTKEE